MIPPLSSIRARGRHHANAFVRLAEWTSLAAAALLFAWRYSQHPARPAAGALGSGWWGWFDQGYYLRATQALSRLDLSVGNQNYEPGYAVIAAPFVHVTPSDPFLLPNLACLLIACWLFGAIAERVADAGIWSRPAGMALFVLATVAHPASAVTWVIPWTTTPIVPLLFGTVLATLSVVEVPRARPCFLAGLLCAAISAFRPGDAVAVALPCAAAILARLARPGESLRDRVGVLVAGVCGGLAGFALFALLHGMIWGTAPSPYMLGSNAIGFNLLLVPLRWVLIVVGPSPLTEGLGLCQVFPWTVSGIGCLVASALLGGRGGRTRHVLLCSMSALFFVLFLSYRDLHPGGMWRYGNVHYFKWLLPLFALYSFRLLVLAARRNVPVLVASLLTIVALFCWRPGLTPVDTIAASLTATPPRSLLLAQGLPRIDDGVLVGADGDWESTYAAAYTAVGPGATHGSNGDFKAYPRPGGFLFLPLRPIGPATTVTFAPGVVLDPAVIPLPVRQVIDFLPPCWLASCAAPDLLAGRPLEMGRSLSLEPSTAERFLDEGWGGPEPGGRWTIAGRAGLLVRLQGLPPGQDALITLVASAYVPPGSGPEEVRLEAAGHAVGEWKVDTGVNATLTAHVPAADIAPNGNLHLSVVIPHPHEPGDFVKTADRRDLGIFLRTLTVEAAR